MFCSVFWAVVAARPAFVIRHRSAYNAPRFAPGWVGPWRYSGQVEQAQIQIAQANSYNPHPFNCPSPLGSSC
jgi:hypothetical protein